jgi:ribosome biogenesis GTPase / thiamine phosphate phosphatase
MKHGRVIATAAKGVWVATADEPSEFYGFQGKDFKGDVYPSALGDSVRVDTDKKIVLEIQDRSNILIRVRQEKSPQPMLSNTSKIFITVNFLGGKFPNKFVDRVLVGILQQKIKAEILVTKKDKLNDKQAEWLRRYADYMSEHVGTAVHIVNTKDKQDVNLFLQNLKVSPDLPVVGFLGPSGSGKSTFIEHLSGHKLITTPVNKKTGKGRHTTSQPQLYTHGKMWLADLPGIKTWYPSTEGVINYFKELITLAGTLRCDIPGCRHAAPLNKDCLLARLWKFSPDEGARAITKLRYQSYEDIMTS